MSHIPSSVDSPDTRAVPASSAPALHVEQPASNSTELATESAATDSATQDQASASDRVVFDRVLKSAAVLIVDDEPGMRNFLGKVLETRTALLELAASAEEAEALRLRFHFDVLLVDIRLPGLSGLEWVRGLRARGVRTHVIYMTAYADLDMAISALRNGADDFIMKPFRAEQMLLALERTLTRRQILRENSLLRLQLDQLEGTRGIVGNSPIIRDTLTLAQRVAPTASTILIEGETGTGKELVARAIHSLSQRSGPFVAINCGTIAPELFESELFGHIKGAFTGAVQSRDGLFLHADRGTLFLDEIGELPLTMQAKLLRVLEERVIRPVGSEREVPIRVRVIAATNRNLATLSSAGEFRSDLYYRLNVLPMAVPPLRERREDIPALVEHFQELLSAELRLTPVELMHADWQRLHQYDWPGNVRELKNVVERTLLMGALPAGSLGEPVGAPAAQLGFPLEWPLDSVERAHIEAVLASFNNNKSAAARQLGVSRKTLERKQQLWRSLEDSG